MTKTRIATALGLLFAATACTPYGPPVGAGAELRDERDEVRLANLLRDKVPGPPQSCINSRDANRMLTVGDHTIAYRVSANLVYVTKPTLGCPIDDGDALVRRSTSTNLCRGEPMTVVDTLNGTFQGVCSFGDFVPYRSRR